MKSLMINYAFNFFEDVLFYIGKDNIRSQKAAEKIGANRIIEPPLKYLIKDSETDWTYRINRANWEKRALNS